MSDSCPSLDLDLSSSTQSSLWLIFALTLTTCCIALILTYYYHTHRIFFSSSTLLMTQCILGGICITCSAAFNIPNTTNNWNSSTCTARVWLLFIGLHLSFSSLSVKLYKLHTIFTNTKITAVHVSDRRMILYCMISLIPFLIILTIWEIITPWNPPKPCDGGGGYIMGCHNTQRYIFMPLLLSMTGVVLLTLGYYIYRTYRIPYIYKDTTRILMVLINTLVTFIIGISVYSSFHESNRPIRQIKLIWSVCMLYGVISNLCILYVPMIYQYLHEPISQTLLEKEEQMLSQMSPTHPTLRNRNIPNREISQLPWSHRQPSQQPIHTITHAVEVEQGMAHGNAIDERLATLINKFDSDSTRMLTLQHEENELLMLAMRKRSEMMSLRQNCLNLRMEIEYLNHHGWNYIQHLQQHQLQTLQQLGTHNNIENLPQSLELLQQHPQLREQLQYLSRHQHTIPQQIPSTTLIQTQTTQTRESQYLQSDNGQSRNIFQHPISQTTRVLESQHTVSSPPPVTMCHVAAAVPVTSNTHPSSPISSPTPAAALAAAAAAAAVPAPTPTPVVVHLNDEPTQTPQFHF